MIKTIDHNIDSSVFLWLDRVLVAEASGFYNYSGQFKKTSSDIPGTYAYAAPHRQFVYDSSISGVNIITGVYQGTNFTPKGTGSDCRIDYNKGEAIFFSAATGTISGEYSFKEVNLYLTNQNAQEVLFESKLQINPKFGQYTGNYNESSYVYPLIFIKSEFGENKTLCYDGLSETIFPYRLTVLADTPYLLRAICSILRDKKETFIPVFPDTLLPFNKYGDLKNNQPFNYVSNASAIQANSSDNLAQITDVSISVFNSEVNNLISSRAFGAFVDIDFQLFRFPHL